MFAVCLRQSRMDSRPSTTTDGYLSYTHLHDEWYRCQCGLKVSHREIRELIHLLKCEEGPP
jgi:hypothetical protein